MVWSMKKTNEPLAGTFLGELRIGGKGIGYVNLPLDQSAEISPEFLRTALYRDQVRVRLLGGESIKGNLRAEVVEIVSRYKNRFVGEVAQDAGVYYLIPDHPKMYVDILLSDPDKAKENLGKKVLVEIKSWGDQKHGPTGEIVQVIGTPGEHETEMQSIVLERGIIKNFLPELEKEAAGLRSLASEEEKARRKDFRQIPTCTIDPIDAKDFDDAISFREVKEGYEVGVHIADVSHFLRPGTALDREAEDRGTSVYLVDRTLPMLPEMLSNDLCSLNANEDKFTFSAVFVLNNNAEVLSEWFGRTVIHSDKRFTYEEAQTVLETGVGPFAKELATLNKLAKKLRKQREDNGSITFDDIEIKFNLGEAGYPLEIYKKERKDAHRLVEDFMLLANRKVAEFVSKKEDKKKKEEPPIFIYRIHDKPDEEKIDNLFTLLRGFGHRLDHKKGNTTPKEINRILAEVKDKPEEHLVERAAIQSMSKAVYSTKNIGHFSLAFAAYTHFTSPIRRYPDVLVHRYLARYLEKEVIKEEERDPLELRLIHASKREGIAQEAERDSIKFKQVEYMVERVGKTFNGIISGVTDWGIFVEDIETRCEGLVRVRELGDDFYLFDQKTLSLVGKNTNKKFRLGDQVRFQVMRADPKHRQIDCKIV